MVLRQLQIVSASKFPAALTHRMHIMTSLPSQLPMPQEGVLLHELNHRISNEFCSAISVVSLAAVRSSNKEVKAALTDVAELLHHYAEVHCALRMPEYGIRRDAAAYLRNLCLSIRRSKLNQMKIDLVLAARRLWLPSDRCWLLGMIVYELITNAARHAFAGRHGWIRVELLRTGPLVECRVLDNGSAPVSFRPGRGLKIARADQSSRGAIRPKVCNQRVDVQRGVPFQQRTASHRKPQDQGTITEARRRSPGGINSRHRRDHREDRHP
jgi:two-component sensor histidine kinase